MSKFNYIIDNGHGGVIDGVYQTGGKRAKFGKEHIYEGEFNRQVSEKVCEMLEDLAIDYNLLVPEESDISLSTRVERANHIHKENSSVLISIHANAGGGTGFEIFTSKGQTESDIIATQVFRAFENAFPLLKARTDKSDGDSDKEAQFYILKKTSCPAILVECAFMDTYEPDFKLLTSIEGVIRFAEAIVAGIILYETETL